MRYIIFVAISCIQYDGMQAVVSNIITMISGPGAGVRCNCNTGVRPLAESAECVMSSRAGYYIPLLRGYCGLCAVTFFSANNFFGVLIHGMRTLGALADGQTFFKIFIFASLTINGGSKTEHFCRAGHSNRLLWPGHGSLYSRPQ